MYSTQLALDFVAPPSRLTLDVSLNLAARVAGRSVFACYSKHRATKDRCIDLVTAGQPALYIGPKKLLPHIAQRHSHLIATAAERLDDRDTFLRVYELASAATPLILENMSRYTVLSSTKFNALHRLRMVTHRRYLIDIVPFTKQISKLYLPWSYLDREVLQYSNGWAFEYNYFEEDDDGRLRRAHDPAFLAEKIGAWSYLDYAAFLPPIRYVDSVLTPDEHARYQARKTQLFASYDNPHKIVTELCDCANMMLSRVDALASALHGKRGTIVVYTNIVKNNVPLRAALRQRGITVTCHTYMTHATTPIDADVVVLYESPLNQNQVAILDVLADIRDGTEVMLCRNDAKADRYLFDIVDAEWHAIDTLTRALWRQQCGSI